jgi:hypothetical protein
MTNADSAAKLQKLIQSSHYFCLEMGKFIELAEREIEFHNTTDFDGMEYLVKAANTDMLNFAKLVCAVEREAESEVNPTGRTAETFTALGGI